MLETNNVINFVINPISAWIGFTNRYFILQIDCVFTEIVSISVYYKHHYSFGDVNSVVDGIHENHENWAPTKYNDFTVFEHFVNMPHFKYLQPRKSEGL